MSTLKTRLTGLLACLSLLLLTAGLPALLAAIGAVPTTAGFTADALMSPDDGTLAIAVIAVAAWVAWLVLTGSVVLELVARLRGLQAPRLPGLGLPQRTAGRLLTAAALLFISIPAATQHAPTHTAPTATLPSPALPSPVSDVSAAEAAPVTTGHQLVGAATAAWHTTKPRSTVAYTVKRGDSLWKIAQVQLGDGRRYEEILALNEDALHGQPDFITPGTMLRLPAPAEPEGAASAETARGVQTHVVEAGDTLSEIAEERLGDAAAYDEIFEASRQAPQPDGEQLTDPDLIRPGWKLTLPATSQPKTSQAAQPSPRRPGPPSHSQPNTPPAQGSSSAPASPPTKQTAPRTPTTPPPPSTTSPPTTASPPDTAEPQRARAATAERPSGATPAWVLPGLTGAGALLAGSLLLVLRQHRRTQQRYRRPGHVIAPPPPELRPVEKTAHLIGTVTAPQVDVLDSALHHLATAVPGAAPPPPPRLRIVELGEDTLTMHLAEHADLPAPWTGEDDTWTAPLDSEFAHPEGEVAPYPMLVSIGHNHAGALVLVNLEELRAVTITGAPETGTALGRHLAAELALNPWSVLVEVDTLGIAPELADIDPLRLHHHDAQDTAFLDRLALELDQEPATVHPDRFRAVIVATSDEEPHPGARVGRIITHHPGRTGAVVVTVGGAPATNDDVVLRVNAAGRLAADALGLDAIAAGLTAEEAAACAALVDLTRDAQNEPVPAAEDVDGDPGPTDQTGALRLAYTEPRPPAPAGSDSLLPLDASTYEQAAATTSADVQRLAPVVPATAATRLAGGDPELDADLASWRDPASPVPRLTLLGPVNARTSGEATAVSRRKPFYVELLAYLALHPNGVTTTEVSDAFSLTPDRARTDLGVVRRWLGTDPRTGQPHLPSAHARRGHQGRGTALYQLQGVLSDLDLFRRLRTRGQVRGEQGMDDLISALGLVSGEPFDEVRPAGWSWLFDGDRLDHIMTCAVVDVAHTVTTHALATEAFDLARSAAETGHRAAPDDEVSRLDLVAVAAATGHANEAERLLIQGIFNRSDDGLGPVELSERTVQIIREHGWDRTRYSTTR